ncbi:helix-turn-helix transcriptional regulator [Nocardia sp. NPDC058519]|uniref:helix-turn-helix transcriptional regulator n=1 Tax=Nocardia sp. NPDC058519 TaxID=3346535 RepID=UPI0036477F37
MGETLRTIRELRGATPLQMAKALGVSRQYIYNIESGRKPLTYVLLAKAATFLDVSQLSIMRSDLTDQVGAA